MQVCGCPVVAKVRDMRDMTMRANAWHGRPLPCYAQEKREMVPKGWGLVDQKGAGAEREVAWLHLVGINVHESHAH
jgi:hypothetical protein